MQENSSFLNSPQVTGRIGPACRGGEGVQLEVAQPGSEGAWDSTSGSARPWLSKWRLRGCCALPWASASQVKQERNWFMLDSSTAERSRVCCDPGERMAFLLNLKDAHLSSHSAQNLSGAFHKWDMCPGTAIRVATRTSSWPGDSS